MIELNTVVHSLEEATIGVSGEIDMNTSPKLRDILKSAIAQNMKKITVDLSKVTYMDSSGIATLVECLQALMSKKGRLTLKAMQAEVKAVFEIAHLTEVFEIVD